MQDIFSSAHLSSWQLYVFLYLVFSIGSSITLSPQDIKASFSGFAIIAVLVLILNLSTLWAGTYIFNAVIGLMNCLVLFYVLLFVLILINLIAALVILLPFSLLRSLNSRFK
jgi:hypothetical protein